MVQHVCCGPVQWLHTELSMEDEGEIVPIWGSKRLLIILWTEDSPSEDAWQGRIFLKKKKWIEWMRKESGRASLHRCLFDLYHPNPGWFHLSSTTMSNKNIYIKKNDFTSLHQYNDAKIICKIVRYNFNWAKKIHWLSIWYIGWGFYASAASHFNICKANITMHIYIDHEEILSLTPSVLHRCHCVSLPSDTHISHGKTNSAHLHRASISRWCHTDGCANCKIVANHYEN